MHCDQGVLLAVIHISLSVSVHYMLCSAKPFSLPVLNDLEQCSLPVPSFNNAIPWDGEGGQGPVSTQLLSILNYMIQNYTIYRHISNFLVFK